MRTPYAQHTFGQEVEGKYRARRGWLTAGVASSIPWPSTDVCIEYDGDEYFLRGSELNGEPSSPGITIACDTNEPDLAISKIYRFTSILSWYMGGYVDVSTYIYGSHPMLCGSRNVYSSLGVAGAKSFNCNHMPIIEDGNIRKALAFWREGCRLDEIHDSYAFLSFYKVIESQFSNTKEKIEWIEENIEKLTDRAAKRVSELKDSVKDVGRHLFDSGRCAVAHASFDGEIVDPDIPEDRRRLSADLVVMKELARILIRDYLEVPDSKSLYRLRNRLVPWRPLLTKSTFDQLSAGEAMDSEIGLQDRKASIGIWPDGLVPGLENMDIHVDTVSEGIVKIVLVNERKTLLLVFFLDFKSGRIHTNLEDGRLLYGENSPDEDDVRAYSTFFYRVLGNGIAEIVCAEIEPVDCEVVIPVNIIPPDPDKAIQEAVDKFRQENNTESSSET